MHLQEIGKLSASVCKAADGDQVSNKSTATEVVPTPYQLEHEATDDFICSIQQTPYIRHAYFAFRHSQNEYCNVVSEGEWGELPSDSSTPAL